VVWAVTDKASQGSRRVLTIEELARQADTTPEYVGRLVEAGAIRANPDGSHEVENLPRVRLALALAGGIDFDDLMAVIRSGALLRRIQGATQDTLLEARATDDRVRSWSPTWQHCASGCRIGSWSSRSTVRGTLSAARRQALPTRHAVANQRRRSARAEAGRGGCAVPRSRLDSERARYVGYVRSGRPGARSEGDRA
jgi:hypothetical protein